MYDYRLFTAIRASRAKFVAVTLIFSFLIFYYPHFLPAQTVGQESLTGFIYSEDGVTPVEGAVVKIRNIVDGTTYESSASDSQGAFKIEGINEGLYSAGISTPTGDFNFENLIGIKAGEPAKISFSLVLTGDQSTSLPEEKSNPVPEEQTSPPTQGGFEVVAPAGGILIGKVVNFSPETQEATILIDEGILQVGDEIIFRGTETDFSQKIESMSVESTNVKKASAGQSPGVRAVQPVEVGDFVFLKKRRMLFFFLSPIGVATVLAASSGIVYGIVKLTEKEEEVSAFKK
jgi:translation elongation factor EF-G